MSAGHDQSRLTGARESRLRAEGRGQRATSTRFRDKERTAQNAVEKTRRIPACSVPPKEL